jgi:replication factor A1
MLATQQNSHIENGSVAKHTVIKLTSFVANAVQGRRLIIVLGLESLDYQGDRIGAPANVESAQIPAKAAPAPPAAAGGGGGGGASSRGPVARQGGAAGAPVFPIEALSPYSNKYVDASAVISSTSS